MLLVCLALAAAVQAVPTLVYPVDTQQPPVARVGKPFSFNLLPGTFNSSSAITYASSGLPSWLSFNAGAQEYYGTPQMSDVGQNAVSVLATDSIGTTNSNWTLLVTSFSVPGVHAAFTTQLGNPNADVAISSATPLPGNTGVSIPPYWSFSLGFQYDTFRVSYLEPTNGELYYAAHLRGMAGLPSWLRFNNDSFTFNGVAPGNGSYTVVVTGTDFWGYTGAQTSFVIEVGNGSTIEQVKGQNLTDISTMSRSPVSYTVDLTNILVNGEPAASNQVEVSVDQSTYPWLSVQNSRTLVGTTPDIYSAGTLTPLSVPITISSTNASSSFALTTWVGLDVLPYLFTNYTLPSATATPSQAFTFNLAPYLRNSSATVNATVSPSDAGSWLMFNPSNLTLSGTPPANPNYNTVNVLFEAAVGSTTATSALKMTLAGVTATGGSGTAAVPTSTSTSSTNSSGGLSAGGKIALGVVFGLIGLIALLALLFICCRRRRRSESDQVEKDDASFVAAEPHSGMPNLFGFTKRPLPDPRSFPSPRSPMSDETLKNPIQPTRLDGLKHIFGWSEKTQQQPVHPGATPTSMMRSADSFFGNGEAIGVTDGTVGHAASSFTQSAESSRASWESRRSYNWSSPEHDDTNRLSAAPSIPRPRPDFTPRYPRTGSPTALARLASERTLASPSFSEFNSDEDVRARHVDQSASEGTGSLLGSSSFPGHTGQRFGSSANFRSIEEEDTEGEGPAVVTMAERQSFETSQPRTASTGAVGTSPRWQPSRQRIASPIQGVGERSQRAIAEEGNGMFDDADEARRSMLAPSHASSTYPASAIMFPSPDPSSRPTPLSPTRTVDSPNTARRRESTIKVVSPPSNVLSPPLPQVGSFKRPRPTSREVAHKGADDGRVIACANETFSIHPAISPPPTVSLSAATWSSAPPSTYRAELEGGAPLPAWLHFDARELELWGVPALKNTGDAKVVRILEKMAKDKRNSNPLAFGYQPQQEREVGRVMIEVVDRLKSPQFALEASPHAM